MEERVHAKRSPSAFKWIRKCPGYLPQKSEVVHENTLRGTKIHNALDANDLSSLDDREYRWAQYCLETRDEYEKLYLVADKSINRYNEIKLVVSEKHESFGFTDSLITQGDQGLMFDWKFGFVKVEEAVDNDQGKGYAIGVFKRFKWIKKLTVIFVQPPLREASSYTFRREDFKELATDIRLMLTKGEEWDKDPAKFAPEYGNPNFDGCLYCARSKDLTCPYMTTALKIIETKVNGFTIPADFDPASLVANNVDLVKILQTRAVIEKIYDAATDLIKAKLLAGEVIEGVEIQHVEGRTTVIDPKGTWEVAKAQGITKQEFENCMSISLTDLKNAVKTKAPRGQKDIAVESLLSALQAAGAVKTAEASVRVKLSK